jgi:hypothetical protein
VRRVLGVGHHHRDHERRVLEVGGVPFLAFDHPRVAVTAGTAGKLLRVSTGLRLGHRVSREDLTVEQRPQISLLLLGRAEHRENLGVAGVRRRTAEDHRSPRATAQDLVHEPQLELAVALSAELRRQVACPEPLLLHLGLEATGHGTRLSVADVELLAPFRKEQVHGLDLLAHKAVHPVELGLEFGIYGKVHLGCPFKRIRFQPAMIWRALAVSQQA